MKLRSAERLLLKEAEASTSDSPVDDFRNTLFRPDQNKNLHDSHRDTWASSSFTSSNVMIFMKVVPSRLLLACEPLLPVCTVSTKTQIYRFDEVPSTWIPFDPTGRTTSPSHHFKMLMRQTVEDYLYDVHLFLKT
jgi:hypothetical protein